MGLTSWKAKSQRDVTVAKNYLNLDEIGHLNRIVKCTHYAEDQAKRRKQVFMRLAEKADACRNLTSGIF